VGEPRGLEALIPDFPLVTWTDAQEAVAREAITSLSSRHAFLAEGERDRLWDLTLAWLRHCLPEDASDRGLAVVGRFLHVWYWLHAHKADEGFADAAQDWWALVQGARPVTDAPLDRATAEVVQDLAALGGPWGAHTATLRHLLGRTVSAFVWEGVRHREARPTSVAAYEAQRTHSIFVGPYLELWRLLERPGPRLRVAHGLAVEQLERATRRHHYLANDLASLPRDATTGRPNLVTLWAAEHDVSDDAARARVLKALRSTEARMRSLAEALTRRDDGDAAWFARLQIGCARGNVEVMRRLHERYRAY